MVVVLFLVAGCSTVKGLFAGDDNATPPTPLAEIEPSREMRLLWSRNVGASAKRRYLKLEPAVDGQRIYAAEVKGDVSAFEITTGDVLWDVDTDSAITGGPGVGDGLVLVGTQDGEVIALNADSGEQRWRARVSSEVLSPPVAQSGVSVVRTQDGKLFGLSSDDGTRRWVYDRTVLPSLYAAQAGPRLSTTWSSPASTAGVWWLFHSPLDSCCGSALSLMHAVAQSSSD